MEEVKQYLLDIGFDDAHLPELFNDDDKSTYTIPELMQAYADHKLKLLGIADVVNNDSGVCPNKKVCKIIMFTSDLDICQKCNKTFEGK